MGKRSRKRVGGAPVAPSKASGETVVVATSADSKSSVAAGGPPKPPWGDAPITELAVLVGLVTAVAGFVIGGSGGTAVMAVGLGLASLAGFEQALREHRSGYRSHAFVLAGIPTAVVIGLMALFGAPKGAYPPVAVAVLIGAWLPIRSAYRRSAASR